METSERIEMAVDAAEAGERLDVFLAGQVEDASRSFLQKVIKDGRVAINQHVVKRSSRAVQEGDTVIANLPPPETISVDPEPIPLDILHEDADVLVINKPAGLVVHPAPGHPSGTLVNAVAYHCTDFERPGEDPIRPGIVHRLDRFTSGVMIVAKTRRAFLSLAEQARDHAFDRRYVALVRGEFKEDNGRIEASIGRSLSDRGKMAVTGVRGKDAVTHFRVRERFGVASLVALQLKTGRTHQIRVHMRFAGRPILGDPLYGVSEFSAQEWPAETLPALRALPGQALHAELLGFEHPASKERLQFTAPPPETFAHAWNALRVAVS